MYGVYFKFTLEYSHLNMCDVQRVGWLKKNKIEKILKTFIDQKFFYRPNYSALGNLVRVTDPTVEDPFK